MKNFNKEFFCLRKNEGFEFGGANFLKHAHSIEYEISEKNDVEHNIAGEIVEVSNSKYSIKLTGKGNVQFNENIVYFISSIMQQLYCDGKKIAFNYLFEKNDMPFTNKEGNILDIAEKDKYYCVPIMRCIVEEKKSNKENWILRLREL